MQSLAVLLVACGPRVEVADDDGGGNGGDGGAWSSGDGGGTTSGSGPAPNGSTTGSSGATTGGGGTVSSTGQTGPGTTTGEPFVPALCEDVCAQEPSCEIEDCMAECAADYAPGCDAEFEAYYGCVIEQTVCDFSPCSSLSSALYACVH